MSPDAPVAAAQATTRDLFLQALRAQLPDLRLLTDPADTEAFRWDETEYMHPGMPLGVAFPASTADVSTLVLLSLIHI